MQFTLKLLTNICGFLFVIVQIEGTYDIRQPTVEALKHGLRFSLPDDGSGINFVEFHSNINEDIKEKELGTIFNRVTAPYKGNWYFVDEDVKLKKGDVLNYWILVWQNGESYTKYGFSYKVEELVD